MESPGDLPQCLVETDPSDAGASAATDPRAETSVEYCTNR